MSSGERTPTERQILPHSRLPPRASLLLYLRTAGVQLVARNRSIRLSMVPVFGSARYRHPALYPNLDLVNIRCRKAPILLDFSPGGVHLGGTGGPASRCRSGLPPAVCRGVSDPAADRGDRHESYDGRH